MRGETFPSLSRYSLSFSCGASLTQKYIACTTFFQRMISFSLKEIYGTIHFLAFFPSSPNFVLQEVSSLFSIDRTNISLPLPLILHPSTFRFVSFFLQNRLALLRGVRALQRPDGSFDSSTEGGENDMRFVYCAAAICHMLKDRDGVGMDTDLAEKYIVNSISYEGAFGQVGDVATARLQRWKKML